MSITPGRPSDEYQQAKVAVAEFARNSFAHAVAGAMDSGTITGSQAATLMAFHEAWLTRAMTEI